MKRSLLILALLSGFAWEAAAQGGGENVYGDPNWSTGLVGTKDRKVVPWPYLRKADVAFRWRVERIIDTREKMNKPMHWPKNPLFTVLEKAIMQEPQRLMVYPNDSMTNPMTPSDIRLKVNYETTIQVQVDPNDPYNVKDSTVQVNFDWESVKRYKIMEEWFFDKKHSLFFGRIIYIAPLYQPYAGGIQAAEQPMCYIRYHDNTLNDSFTFRHVAVNEEMFNRDNDAQRITFDDWFELRMFSSYIIKESNPWDFKIKEMDEYKDSPVDALLESDRIKNMLFEKEHDLWEY